MYQETPPGMTVNLYPLQDLFSVSTAVSRDCPVVHLPVDCGDIWMSIDESKIHMELFLCMVSHNFFLNGNALFEFNMFVLLPHHLPL